MGSIDIFDSAINTLVTLSAFLILFVTILYVNLDTNFKKTTLFVLLGLALELLSSYLGYNIAYYSSNGIPISLLVFVEMTLLLTSMIFLALAASRFLINDVPDLPIIASIVVIGLISIIYFVVIQPDGNMVRHMRYIFPATGFAYISAALWSRVRQSHNRGCILAAVSTSLIAAFILLRMFGFDYFVENGWYLPCFTYISLTISFLVMKTDFVEKKLADREDEVERYNRRIEEIIKLSPFPIVISRLSDDKIILANNNAVRLFGMNPNEIDRYKLKDFFADAENRQLLNERLEKEKEVQDFEILVKTPSGDTPFWLLTSANIIDYNYDIALYAAFQDITSRKNRESVLKNQAVRDPLTSLYNRRYFEEEVSSRIAFARTSGAEFSVLMVDADHFKNVNDSYGHKVGDKVLIELALTCEKALRDDDIVARYGGEEFVIFLSNASPQKAFTVAERLRETISKLVMYSDEGESFRFTVSIGISSSQVSDNIDTLIKTADEALYRAKENGRNRCEIFKREDLEKFKNVDKKKDDDVSRRHPIFAKEGSEEISLLDGIESNQMVDEETSIEEKK